MFPRLSKFSGVLINMLTPLLYRTDFPISIICCYREGAASSCQMEDSPHSLSAHPLRVSTWRHRRRSPRPSCGRMQHHPTSCVSLRIPLEIAHTTSTTSRAMPDAQPVARISNVRPLRAQTTALLDVTASSRASSRARARPHRVDSRTKKLATLEAEVQSLRAEVTRLLQLRQVLREQALNRVDASMGSPCRIVKKYFDVFQGGYNPPALPSPDGFHPDTFLESIMDEAVVGGGFHGVDIMVEQWKRYSTAFVGSQINFKTAHVTCVDMADDGVTMSRVYVQATAYYFGYLTLAGVQAMFPHVITNAGLVMSLIGQLIGGDGRYLFVFDCETQRIVECRIDIDMVSAFAKVVERPQDLELLFGTALLTSQYYMGDDVPEPSEFDPLMPEPILCDESKKDADEQMNLERILS